MMSMGKDIKQSQLDNWGLLTRSFRQIDLISKQNKKVWHKCDLWCILVRLEFQEFFVRQDSWNIWSKISQKPRNYTFLGENGLCLHTLSILQNQNFQGNYLLSRYLVWGYYFFWKNQHKNHLVVTPSIKNLPQSNCTQVQLIREWFR